MTAQLLNTPINLYLSTEHDCSYIEHRQANSLFVDPDMTMTAQIYSQLIQQGFRRSGNHTYTPYCKKCHDCIPVRLNIEQFTLSRSQKRCLNKNKQLQINEHSSSFNPEHYQMYCQYVSSRHEGGGMDDPSEASYMDFLTSSWSETQFFEFKEDKKLIAVAVTDIVDNGLSAVYTFFDPNKIYQARSLGVYSILWQIQEAKRRGLQWLYLGYWIKQCKKMNYKDKYQPLEYFYDQRWNILPPEIAE